MTRSSAIHFSGDHSSIDHSSGDYSSGDYSSGDYSSGDYSSGDYSSGDYSSGDYYWVKTGDMLFFIFFLPQGVVGHQLGILRINTGKFYSVKK